MKLYYADTLMPRLACAVATLVRAPVEFVRVDLFRGEQKTPRFLALNPNGKVPVLEDGDLRLWEADAIACHLARRFQPALWPEAQTHELVRWLSWNARHFTQAGSILYFEHVIKGQYLKQAPSERAVERGLQEFRAGAQVLAAHLANRRFVLGEELTLADLALATALPWTEAAQLPLDEWPVLRHWYAAIESLEGWRHPYPAKPLAFADLPPQA
ncbi:MULTISPECIES: glutathione S-transferase family protein [Ramlibacter]|uniref:Glutathione S-transferase family protein n=1 Tax=Ramlibacter aquaticus TaxID=2780094 RepID=A0ABR9SK30_9BURK|nr:MULTISPECIES: glutathione S-transferase family protein [Ramlibacter]MBE7942663.1 glutathione S-transferase family protein [Ramlibacter aquaticus]